jgi:hypothetical protein
MSRLLPNYYAYFPFTGQPAQTSNQQSQNTNQNQNQLSAEQKNAQYNQKQQPERRKVFFEQFFDFNLMERMFCSFLCRKCAPWN